jgi:hypothetical protein
MSEYYEPGDSTSGTPMRPSDSLGRFEEKSEEIQGGALDDASVHAEISTAEPEVQESAETAAALSLSSELKMRLEARGGIQVNEEWDDPDVPKAEEEVKEFVEAEEDVLGDEEDEEGNELSDVRASMPSAKSAHRLRLEGLVPGMASDDVGARVVPSKGPEMGGQSVIVTARGLRAYKITTVTVCNVPASVERQSGSKVYITTGPKTRGPQARVPEVADGDVVITTEDGSVFVFRCV